MQSNLEDSTTQKTWSVRLHVASHDSLGCRVNSDEVEASLSPVLTRHFNQIRHHLRGRGNPLPRPAMQMELSHRHKRVALRNAISRIDDLYRKEWSSDDPYLLHGYMKSAYSDLGFLDLSHLFDLHSYATFVLVHALHRPIAVLGEDQWVESTTPIYLIANNKVGTRYIHPPSAPPPPPPTHTHTHHNQVPPSIHPTNSHLHSRPPVPLSLRVC